MFSVALAFIISINAVSGYFFYPNYQTDDFSEITEFKKVTEQNTGNFWNFESTKRTIIEKTEVRTRTRTPSYSYYNYPTSYGNSYDPFSSWRFREPYDSQNYIDSHHGDYYYEPRYDSNLGYYNWRW